MKRRLVIFLSALITASMLAGCGAGKSDSFVTNEIGYDYAATAEENYDIEYEAGDAYVNGSVSSQSGSVKVDESSATDRKLIKNVNLEVETKEYDLMVSDLEVQIANAGGYIESMDSYNGSQYNGRKNNRYADVTIRIPQNKLNEFLNTISEACNVIRRNDSVNDVTLTYVDTKSRKEALEVEQTRLLQLLEKAEDLSDIIVLEDRLTDVRYQLDSLESQLRSIDNKVTYSTVHLNISEVLELTPVNIKEPTAWERISTGFMRSLKDVANAFKEIGIWLIVNLPRLIVWGVIIFMVVFFIRRFRRKKNTKKSTKKGKNEQIAETMSTLTATDSNDTGKDNK